MQPSSWWPPRLPGRPASTPQESRETTEPPFDPTSWHGALLVMVAAAGVLWAIQIATSVADLNLQRFGLRPRELDGLWGVATEPFLHASYGHLFSNTTPFVLIGWVLLLSGVRTWFLVTGLVMAIGGMLTWLIAPHGLIVGASGVIFGWLGYLLARAYFSRRLKWIITAVLVLFFFGTMLFSLLPHFGSNVSWQAHVAGFVAGVIAAAMLHPRESIATKSTGPQWPAVS